MYSRTVSSFTAPTVAQKSPRAHRCRPQNRLRRCGHSSRRRRDERPGTCCARSATSQRSALWRYFVIPTKCYLMSYLGKPMTLIDQPKQPLIGSLRYFEGVLGEVREQSFPARYWQHLEFNLDRCKQYWQAKPETAPGSARPLLD